jgi:hypothetical protein
MEAILLVIGDYTFSPTIDAIVVFSVLGAAILYLVFKKPKKSKNSDN